jgi:hypothetical protein
LYWERQKRASMVYYLESAPWRVSNKDVRIQFDEKQI